jgi:hypothetical protein
VIGGLLLVTVITASGFGWNYYHQRTISPVVKAAVAAAVDTEATDADRISYLRAAKLASRTKRDIVVVDKLQRMMELLDEWRHVLQLQKESEAADDALLRSCNVWERLNRRVESVGGAKNVADCSHVKQLYAISRDLAAGDGKVAAMCRKRAGELLADLRAAVELPPLRHWQ